MRDNPLMSIQTYVVPGPARIACLLHGVQQQTKDGPKPEQSREASKEFDEELHNLWSLLGWGHRIRTISSQLLGHLKFRQALCT